MTWVLEAGEIADFDTQVPHWFASTGDAPAEVLSLYGRHGETAHLRSAVHPTDQADARLALPLVASCPIMGPIR